MDEELVEGSVEEAALIVQARLLLLAYSSQYDPAMTDDEVKAEIIRLGENVTDVWTNWLLKYPEVRAALERHRAKIDNAAPAVLD